MTTKRNDKIKPYSYSEIEEYDRVAKAYVEFAKERYGIDFRIPKLTINKGDPGEKTGELFSNIAGTYIHGRGEGSINIYIDQINGDSDIHRKDELSWVISHELGHALADQLHMGFNLYTLDANGIHKTLNKYIGGELVANIFGAEMQAKLKNKPVTSTETAKQLLANINLSLADYDDYVSTLTKDLNKSYREFNKFFNGLNKKFDSIKDEQLDLARKDGNGINLKFNESYIAYYREFFDYYVPKINLDIVYNNRYLIPEIAAASALANGVSADEIINTIKSTKKKLFSIHEFEKYGEAAKASMDIEDLKSSGIGSLELYNLIYSDKNIDGKKGVTVDKYRESYDLIVQNAKNEKDIIKRSIDKTIEALPIAFKELKDVRSRLYPDSDKLRK